MHTPPTPDPTAPELDLAAEIDRLLSVVNARLAAGGPKGLRDVRNYLERIEGMFRRD